MLVAHLADTHLGYRQYNLEERELDFYEAFREAVGRAVEEHVDVLVHAGDFFDEPRPPVRALYEAKRQLARLRDRGVKVYAVLGDHDLPRRRGMPPHDLFAEHVATLGLEVDHDVVELGGSRLLVAGLHHHSHRFREGLREGLRRLAKLAEGFSRSVLILHQSIDRFLPFEYELSFDELPSSFSYVAMGHVHRRGSAWLHRTLVSYAGSLEVARRDEVEAWREVGKGFFIVDLGGDEPTLHKVDLGCVRPQLEASVRYEGLRQGLAKLAEEARGCRKPPIVHLRVEGAQVDRRRVYEEVQAALSPCVLAWRLEVAEEAAGAASCELKGGLDYRQLFKEVLRDEEAASLAYELFKLLKDPSKVEEAKKLVEEYYERWSGRG
jgi:DNA repair exonuclease SbcCD nuclease subunit